MNISYSKTPSPASNPVLTRLDSEPRFYISGQYKVHIHSLISKSGDPQMKRKSSKRATPISTSMPLQAVLASKPTHTTLPECLSGFVTTSGFMPLQCSSPSLPIFESTPQIGKRKSGLFASKSISMGTNLRAPDSLVVFQGNIFIYIVVILCMNYSNCCQSRYHQRIERRQ